MSDLRNKIDQIPQDDSGRSVAKKAGKIVKRIVVGLLITVASIAAIIGVIYLAQDYQVVSFTQHSQTNDGDPLDLVFRMSYRTPRCTVSWYNRATGESGRFSKLSDNNELLYFNEAEGSMHFWGEVFNGRSDVLEYGDIGRDQANVTPKTIEIAKPIFPDLTKTVKSDVLARQELVWLFFHPEDNDYFQLDTRTY